MGGYTSGLGGFGDSGAGLDTEPIAGNSLTSYIRSIEGLTGQQGNAAIGAGQGVISSGLAGANQSASAAAPSLDFLTKLVKGDQGDVTQAEQPQIDQINQQFDQIRNMISSSPRGGGKTTALAEAPFQKAGDIARMEGSERTKAAGELGNLSTQLAGIDLGEADLGLSEAGLGAQLEGQSANTALTTRGQDFNNTFAAQFNQILTGIGQLI